MTNTSQLQTIAPNRKDSAAEISPGQADRIQSIDIFRGLNVLAMIFVDNLGFVTGLPWWTYHMPREANGMTYVDMVFPAFLFLMGMAIPVSVRSRMARGQTRATIWAHVVVRSMSLVALGLFVANAPQVDAPRTGISFPWWAALGFVAIGLVWIDFPWSDQHRTLVRAMKFIGLGMLVGLAAIFRRSTPDGGSAWLDFSDWEILGLLGWAYLCVSAIYLLLEKRILTLAGALAVLIAVNALSVAGHLGWLAAFPPYLKPFEAGLASLTMAGLLTSLIIVSDAIAPTFKKKAWWALGSAVALLVTGYLLKPLGISKLRDTPTWCLYCMSANIVIALFLYWLADLRGLMKWAGFTKPVGTNPLLSYFLPYVAYFSPTLFHLTADGTSGMYGVLRSLLFAALILILVTAMNRFGIKLRV